MDIFSFILGRSSNEQESYQRVEDIKRETGLRNLEFKELELETARIIDRGTLNKLIVDLNRDEKQRDNYINIIDKINDIQIRYSKKAPELHDKEYFERIEKQKNIYISLLNDINKEITRKTIYINEIKNNIDRLKAKGGEYLAQVKREIRRRWDNIYYIFNSSAMLIADLHSDNINNRYIFLVLEKENFTNENPEEFKIYHIKYFINFWLNYRKVGGENGFYYLQIDNPLIGHTFIKDGINFPEYPKIIGKGEFIARTDNFHLSNVSLLINDGINKNPFREVYKDPYFIASEIYVNKGKKKFRDNQPPLTVGSKKEKMRFLKLIMNDLIPTSNIFVLDIYNG